MTYSSVSEQLHIFHNQITGDDRTREEIIANRVVDIQAPLCHNTELSGKVRTGHTIDPKEYFRLSDCLI